MSDLNSCNFTGRLTRDPELRSTQGGTPVLSFGLAVNDSVANAQTGKREDRPNYLDVIVFGSRGEALEKILRKGRLVAVDARARWSSWEKDGSRHSKVEFVARDIQLLGPKPKDDGTQEPDAQAHADYPEDQVF